MMCFFSFQWNIIGANALVYMHARGLALKRDKPNIFLTQKKKYNYNS